MEGRWVGMVEVGKDCKGKGRIEDRRIGEVRKSIVIYNII